MVAKSREGLQSYSRKVWVGVAKLTLQKISYNGIPFFFRNHYPNFATISLQPPPQLCNLSYTTSTTTLQPLVCNPHPNSATPALQPSPQVCARSFATATLTLQPFLCHPRRRARKPKNLNAYFLAKIRFDTAENEPAKNFQKKSKTLSV